ncbi:hypothetical protein FF125_17390 [Aureibaculum algae]|uniref:Uncharacterized protein n=1 Tax=Aureibaculum algae TaxID=2584122 RepID=A0A5B7TZM4_9FLAO|nr:hypothetical protein [Aureibaculum algae]QCX40132.1 hypothetical protein FF125_17390 [Aureibaculum algae]
MNSLDPLLNNLNNYSNELTISKKLKKKFLNKFWDHYQFPLEERTDLSIECFDIGCGRTYDNDGEVLNEPFFIEHRFNDFLIAEIKVEFGKFNASFYHDIKFYLEEKNKIQYYIDSLAKQLNQILNEIQDNKSISEEYRIIIIREFKKWIEIFKNKEYKYLIPKRNYTTPSSFLYDCKEPEYYENLNDLYGQLIKAKLINENSNKTDFLNIFKNSKIVNKIRWQGTISEFYYFIKKLNDHKDFKDLKNTKWEVASKCFYLPSKNAIDEFDWRKLRTQKNPTESKCKLIDNYLKF